MREEAVRAWMRREGLADTTISTQMSKMRKLDRHFGDLDELIRTGRVEGVASTLADPASLPRELGSEGERNHLRQSLRYYRRFVDSDGSNTGLRGIDRSALDQLKQRFLKEFPDFEGGGGFTGRSRFHTEEDDYKRALIDRAGTYLAEHRSDHQKLGGLLLDLIANGTDLESNLLGWRMAAGLSERRKEHPGVLELAAANIALADDPITGVNEFVDQTWSTVFASHGNNPYGDVRTIPTLVAAIIRPNEAISLRTDRFNTLYETLFSRRLFKRAPLSREELEQATEVARELRGIIDQEWGWHPRDLWDVQGFIWVSCATETADKRSEMTDDELLKRFEGGAHFRTARAGWSEEQVKAFCNMARAIHAAGLDWYHTQIPETRFGRKRNAGADANGTLGSLQLQRENPFIQSSHQHQRVGLSGNFPLTEGGSMDFRAAVEEIDDAISTWQADGEPRPGRWPDDYETESETVPGGMIEVLSDVSPTNLILYGPPGTGKTYATMRHAVRLCGEDPAADRTTLRRQYDQLRREKRIEFVTFHQNFAYEEFVEGLRPHTGGEDSDASAAGFELKPKLGIFRNICQLAEAAVEAAEGGQPFKLESRRVFKMSLGRAGLEDHIFQDAIDNSYAVLGWGGDIDWAPYSTYESIHERWNQDHPETNGNDANIIQTARFRADMREGDIIIVSHGNKLIRAIGVVAGPYRYEPSGTRDYSHRRDVEWLKVFREPIDYSVIYDVPFIQWSCYLLKEQHLNKIALTNLLPGIGGPAASPKQYVLVIDEINRANISKVFGELITLIEPDKRIGMVEELKVRLPYSEDEFGVPANLHIIGTMNTADRSIALLDTALRRRFQFEEMAPDVSVDAFQRAEAHTGLPLTSVLHAMNKRIEYLVDRDHRIGHAFFIGCKTKVDVDAVMRDKVIPLLQEYFFDDWNRLAAVLGEKEKGGNFLTCETIEDPMGEGGEPLRSWRVRALFDDTAYERLVSGKVQTLPEAGASQQ